MPPIALAGSTAGVGAPARPPGGATGQARVSLRPGPVEGSVSGPGQDLVPVPDMVMVTVVVVLGEVATEVAAVQGEMKAARAVAPVVTTTACHQLRKGKTSTAEHKPKQTRTSVCFMASRIVRMML